MLQPSPFEGVRVAWECDLFRRIGEAGGTRREPGGEEVKDVAVPNVRRGDDRSQIKTRERVRDLAEVYTHKREVDAMLDLVPNMFPSDDDPSNTDRTFLEPACGSGNFLEEILHRKLVHVTARRYGRGERYEQRILRCLASIYGIDIDETNVAESRSRLRGLIASHVDNDLNTKVPTAGFAAAVEAILSTNIQRANTLTDAESIVLVQYHASRSGMFVREWSFLQEPDSQMDLFGAPDEPSRDANPIHYSELAANPRPVAAERLNGVEK